MVISLHEAHQLRKFHDYQQSPAERAMGDAGRRIGRLGDADVDLFSAGEWRAAAPPSHGGAVLAHPTLGRILFPPARVPARSLRRDDVPNVPGIGGGAYPRALAQPAAARIYRVRKLCAEGEFSSITQAIGQWSADRPHTGPARAAVIEIADSASYHEAPSIRLFEGEELQLRAASAMQPVLRMSDHRRGAPGQLAVQGAPGSRLTLDGLMLAGGGFEVHGGASAQDQFHVTLRHCTLVPGWDAEAGRDCPWAGNASVTLATSNIALRVEHSILGPIRMPGEANGGVQLALHISDSILDAGHAAGLVIADARYGVAMARATIVRSTMIGLAQLHEIALAENTIFLGPLLVARRDKGCIRFCYMSPVSRTPERVHCQPDRSLNVPGSSFQPAEQQVMPRFRSLRYGTPGYCRLAPDCAREITSGADDDTQMGVFHGMEQVSSGTAFETQWEAVENVML